MAARFATLTRAQLSYDYLHTNSTTHEFLFGAIAEMVDNSKDAAASSCAIWAMHRPQLRGGRILCFLDDGAGMSPEEARGVVTFGYSAKRRDPNMIGQYGNGLKSGAMRIGKDLIVLTKKGDAMTCIFLSRTFHEGEGIDEVIVPTPSFTLDGSPSADDLAKHELEMEVITRHSPFTSMDDLQEQFNLLKNESGTLIMIYNLKLNEEGLPELDFLTDPYDIRVNDPDGNDKALVPERCSLRAYLSVIYAYPHMKIYLNGKKVRTRSVIAGLYKPKQYRFASTKFKMRAEQQIKELNDTMRVAQERKKEGEMRLKEFERKNPSVTNKEIRAKWRKLQDEVQVRKQEVERLKANTDAKIRLLKDPKMLTFMFGLNLENRSHNGCFIYNNGRLIKMYEKVGPQRDSGLRGSGVIGVVDVPFTVMAPTHNKQDFADNREYQQLLRAMGDHLEQYWNDVNLAKENGGVLQFWQQFGYSNAVGDWSTSPSIEERYRKKRMMNVNITLQCDLCLKWRVLPFESRYLKDDWPPDSWTCANNPDTANNKCNIQEKPIQVPVGKLQKETVTVEQKREQLEKRIEKQKAEVEKLAGLTTVRSRNDLIEAEKKRREQETVSSRRPVQQTRQSAPVSSARNTASTRSRKRVRSPTPSPPPPPPRKPRTKAELRKQIQNRQRTAQIVSEDEDDDCDTVAVDAAKTVPVRKRGTPPAANVVDRRARKSVSATKSIEEPSSTTPSAGRVIVQKEEAHSTGTFGNDGPSVSGVVSPDMSMEETTSCSSIIVESTVPARSNKREERNSGSASTTFNESAAENNMVQKLKKMFSFFLPPDFKHTKEDISFMSKEQLMAIDLKEFFEAYENGLTKLISAHKRATETANNDLKQLRLFCIQLAESQGVDLDEFRQGLPDSIDQALKTHLQKYRKL